MVFPDWDRELFVYLNSKHTSSLDPIMYFLSDYSFWIATCLLVMAYTVYSNQSTGKVAAIFIFVSVGFNSLINRIVKLFVMRPRPGADLLLHDIA